MSLRQDLKDLLTKEGLSYRGRTSKNHQIWSDGKIEVVVPSTPSDCRAIQNARARIRKERRSLEEKV